MASKLLVITLFFAFAFAQSAQDDYVWMNIPNYTHDWYSGYLNISYKDIHYVYLESQNDRDNDPLILWVGGGPGCSGLYSMFYEIGPFRLLTPESPQLNVSQESWNKRANLLFLEAPGAVGFSTGPVNSTDVSTVDDLLYSLIEFMSRFPTLKKNDFYLAGHGYAGILIPQLATLIDQRNQMPYFMKINLKGFLLGNPCTDPKECYASGADKQSYYHYQFLYNHAFFTDSNWTSFRGACNLNYSGGICYRVRQDLDSFFNSTNTSYYNIYSRCYKSNNNIVNTNCDDQKGILDIMNGASFQQAIHVTPGQWSVCNSEVFRQYLGTNEGSYALYKNLLAKKKYNIFVYSGDLDSSVPTIGTKEWVKQMKEDYDIPVRRTWREWWVPGMHPHEDQVGGMVWELEGLTLATVKGAGFAVGKDKSTALYEIFDAWINNKRLPLTSRLGRKTSQKK